MPATKSEKSKSSSSSDLAPEPKVKKFKAHERCPICKYPFGTGTCDSCKDPKCTSCGQRLLTIEVEVGTQCVRCSPEATENVRSAVTTGKRVAIVLID